MFDRCYEKGGNRRWDRENEGLCVGIWDDRWDGYWWEWQRRGGGLRYRSKRWVRDKGGQRWSLGCLYAWERAGRRCDDADEKE